MKAPTKYAIYRIYATAPSKLIKSGLTLEQAQAHCKDPETSSSTCSHQTAITETDKFWFDTYEVDDTYR
jgi:hypothetical protein